MPEINVPWPSLHHKGEHVCLCVSDTDPIWPKRPACRGCIYISVCATQTCTLRVTVGSCARLKLVAWPRAFKRVSVVAQCAQCGDPCATARPPHAEARRTSGCTSLPQLAAAGSSWPQLAEAVMCNQNMCKDDRTEQPRDRDRMRLA